MNKKILRRMFAFVLIAAIALSVIGCGASGSNNTSSTTGTPPAKASETGEAKDVAPTPIRFFRVAVTQDPTKDRTLIELQKRTNTKLEFVTAPWDQQGTKLNTILASGEMIDIMALDDSQVAYTSLARNGTLLELDKYLQTDKYPIEKAIAYDPLYKKLLVDDKCYSIAEPIQPGGGWIAGIRKDWLDKVGLPVPKNDEELFQVFKAFKEKDPDGNNQNDTQALLVTPQDPWYFLEDVYTQPINFLEDGQGGLDYRYTSDAYKKGMQFIKKLYDNNLLNKDMFTIKDKDISINQFIAGTTGIAFSPMWAKTLAETKKNNPDTEIELLFPTPHADTTNGATASDAGWYWLLNVLPKTCRNPEKALEFLEYCNSDEGRKLICVGIEGIHYESYDNGVFTGINEEEQAKDWDPKNAEGPTGSPTWWGLTSTINGTVDYINNYGNLLKAFQNCVTFVSAEDKQSNPYYEQRKLISTVMAHESVNTLLESMTKYQGKLTSIRDEYKTKLILSKESEFDKIWNEYVDRMNQNGLDEVMKEATEWYNQNK